MLLVTFHLCWVVMPVIFLAPFGLCWGPQTSRAGLAVSMKPTSDKGLLFPLCDRLQHETNHKEGQTLNRDTTFVRILRWPQRHLTWRFNLQNGLKILISSVSLLFGFKTWGSSMVAFLRFSKCVSFIFKFVGPVFQRLSYDHNKTIWRAFIKALFGLFSQIHLC